MFGRKKKEILPLQRRCRDSILREALALIAAANKAEAESLESGDAESTAKPPLADYQPPVHDGFLYRRRQIQQPHHLRHPRP